MDDLTYAKVPPAQVSQARDQHYDGEEAAYDRASHQERLQAIVESALDALFVANDEGRYIDVNPAACALTGYDRAELLARSVWDLTPSSDVERGRAAWQQFLHDQRASGEYQLLRRDGSLIDVEFRAVAHALPHMHVSACRDISARKEHEQLRRQLAAIVEASSEAIIGKTLDGIVTAWNPGARRIYGYTAEEMLGRSISVLIPPERTGELDMILQQLRRGERLENYSTIRVAKDGRRIEVSASIFPVTGDDGKSIGAAIIARDVTEQNHRHREAARGERLRALGQLASGVAHDLNQSLSLILGYGELLQDTLIEHGLDVSPFSEMLGIISGAAQDGGETVKRLLTFARGEPDTPREQLDVSSLLNDVARLTAPRWRHASQSEGRPIVLTVEADSGLSLQGHGHQLREALINLVLNAVDALPEGGAITLAASRDGEQIIISVSDTGMGMSADAQARMFEPFFTTKGERGSGLGLPTVFGIVENHAGTITVASVLGQGTTISLRLPQADASDAASIRDNHVATRPRSLRILAVDDEPEMSSMVARMLERLGYHVTTEQSGEAGLQRLAGEPFDLVITDIGLGAGMNGWEFVEQLRRHHQDLPVLLATGWGAAIQHEEIARFSPCTVVPKPFRLSDLERAIAAVMAT